MNSTLTAALAGEHIAALHRDAYHNELEHLDELAELIDTDGLGAHEGSVRVVARVGGPVAPVAASVLGDPLEPVVARLRAFAVVTAALRSEGKQEGSAAA